MLGRGRGRGKKLQGSGGEGPGLPRRGLNESGAGQLAQPEAAPPHLALPTAVPQRAAHASSQLSSGRLEQNLAASLIFFCLSPPTRRKLVETLPVSEVIRETKDERCGRTSLPALPSQGRGLRAKGLRLLRERVPSSCLPVVPL